MLPEALSADLCSLREGEARACLAVEMIFNREGHKLKHRFVRGLMRSAAKLTYAQAQAKTVYYLSAEFLMGRHLGNGLINLGLYDTMRHALSDCDLDLDELLEREAEPGLGNGGLGRLAACFMDSLTTLNLPAVGYGIRYEFGIFTQVIHGGHQVEVPDKWLSYGNPWEIARPDYRVEIKFGGHTEVYKDSAGDYQVRWIPGQTVMGIPHDVPVPGYGTDNVNLLRLWKAEAGEAFDLGAFNAGDYAGAVANKMMSENITKVLYPNDEQIEGKQLRLEQQFFFVSCALQDMIRIHLASGRKLDSFHEKFTGQLNDTHPAMVVPELMRILLDKEDVDWDKAWEITVSSSPPKSSPQGVSCPAACRIARASS